MKLLRRMIFILLVVLTVGPCASGIMFLEQQHFIAMAHSAEKEPEFIIYGVEDIPVLNVKKSYQSTGVPISQDQTTTPENDKDTDIDIDIDDLPEDRPKPPRAKTQLFDEKEDILTNQISTKKPAKAKLEVLSKPTKADWYIDGEYMGTTTGKKDIEKGIYLITVSKAGYIDWEKRITVLPDKKVEVVARLKKIKKIKRMKKIPVIGGF
ncbi:MAG: PEGA domain-containing protein [Bacteroidales bacterium]|nr:PEGA domain-containing protein [Bacteroidales bacterium]